MRPLSDFIAEVEARAYPNPFRRKMARVMRRIRVRWLVWRHPAPWPVSQEAFDAFSADTETLDAIRAAIAIEARQRTDPEEGLDPKGESAGGNGIAPNLDANQ